VLCSVYSHAHLFFFSYPVSWVTKPASSPSSSLTFFRIGEEPGNDASKVWQVHSDLNFNPRPGTEATVILEMQYISTVSITIAYLLTGNLCCLC